MNPISYELALMQRDERLRQAAVRQLACQAGAQGRAPMHAATPGDVRFAACGASAARFSGERRGSLESNPTEESMYQSNPSSSGDPVSHSSLMLRLARAHIEELRRVRAEQPLRSAHPRPTRVHRTIDPQTVIGTTRSFKPRFGLARRVALRIAVRG